MKIQIIEKKPGLFLASLEGDLDMSTSPAVRQELLPLFRKGTRRIIVDLAGVPYIDSSGIATFVECLQLSIKGDLKFTLAGASPTVESIFELAYLRSVFEMVPDAERLLAEE